MFSPPPQIQSEMLDVRSVAALLNCSTRHALQSWIDADRPNLDQKGKSDEKEII